MTRDQIVKIFKTVEEKTNSEIDVGPKLCDGLLAAFPLSLCELPHNHPVVVTFCKEIDKYYKNRFSKSLKRISK